MNKLEHARRVGEVRRLLSRQIESDADDPALESTPAQQIQHPDDVLARVEATLRRMPPDEVDDPDKFRSALATLLTHGDRGLRRLAASADPIDLDSDALVSLEAIVIADGTRPSFLLRSGRVAADHPFLGDWKIDIDARGDALARLASAVGRIQPMGGHAGNYVGTGTLVDRENGLVLTNFHVADDARNKFGIEMEERAGRWRVNGNLFVDFGAESGSLASDTFRVLEVLLPDGAERGSSNLDAAVLRIDTASAPNLPSHAVKPNADPDFANGGASARLCTIGIPGAPVQVSPEGVTIDWDFVVGTLFGNRFGFKRLAPGRFLLPPGAVAGGAARHVMTHDATTFGGASGSLLFALSDPSTAAFGLHFSGRTGESNHAVSLAVAVDPLRRAGVQFV